MENTNDILEVIDFIEEHLSEELSLEKIAESAGYSKYHFSRIFARAVGRTVFQYIQQRRLTEAARALVTTNNAIVTIAFEAKYESQQAFSFAFRQMYLVSPYVYREKGVFYPLQERFATINCIKFRKNCEVMAA